jgi:hypothetical protein
MNNCKTKLQITTPLCSIELPASLPPDRIAIANDYYLTNKEGEQITNA